MWECIEACVLVCVFIEVVSVCMCGGVTHGTPPLPLGSESFPFLASVYNNQQSQHPRWPLLPPKTSHLI